MWVSGRGWQSGINSCVRLAAIIPATRAVASTSPFGARPSTISASVSGARNTLPRAVASRVVVSELAGRGNVLSKAEELGLGAHAEGAANVVARIKELEARGFHFEAADASVEMMLRRERADYRAPFQLLDFMVVVEHREGRGLFAEGSVKLRVNGEVVHTVAEGNGPVNALDNALRKALRAHYPAVDAFQLEDYKVRILDGDAGTGATTRVLIETANHVARWSTVGASTNIIEASWWALADAVEYGLMVSA